MFLVVSMLQSPQERCITLQIGGMTCASCELLLERRLKAVPGIKNVDVHHKTGRAQIIADAKSVPGEEQLAAVIRKAGYTLIDGEAPTVSTVAPDKRKWLEIGASLLIIFALYKLLQAFDLLSLAPSTSGALSIGGIFLIGLIAGTSSCLAVTGGLLLALAAKHNEVHQAETSWERFRPLLHFNVGRLTSYFVLGGCVGVLGQSITVSAKVTGYMNIIVALVMIYLALTILQILPKGSFPIRPPKKLSRWIAGLSESKNPAAPLSLGAMTFFLPCGFTQSLQLIALASGNFATGALVMSTFALGTLPSLLGLSALSSAAKGKFSRLFLRFSGSIVLILALFNLQSGLTLTGIPLSGGGDRGTAAAPPLHGNVQEIAMKVTSTGYEPSALTVKAGIPVRWTIDGTDASGCTSILVIPDLDVTQPLRSGPNIVEFTAPKPGPLTFTCSMGMVYGTLHVI